LEVAFPVRIRYLLFIGLVPFVFGFLIFHRPSCQMSRERTTRLFSTIQGTSPDGRLRHTQAGGAMCAGPCAAQQAGPSRHRDTERR
jgi:hypothetical protein